MCGTMLPVTIGICASCDKLDRRLAGVGAYDGTMFCLSCIEDHGATELRSVANAALAVRKTKKEIKCFRCSAPLIEGSKPMCTECNGRYQARFGKAVRWG
jgi:hypothetical protein